MVANTTGDTSMVLGESPLAKEARIQRAQSRVGAASAASAATVDLAAPTPDVPITAFTAREPTGTVPKSQEKLDADAYVSPVVATKLESMGAAMGGLAIDFYREGKSMYLYDRDPDFDPSELNDEFFTKNGAGTKLEVEYLAGARTHADWLQKSEYVIDQRMRNQAMADNPWTAGAASIIDADLVVSAVPIVGWGSKAARAGKASRVATRAKAGAVAAGATVGIQSLQGTNTLRTDNQQLADTLVVGLARAFAPMSKAAVASTEATQAASKTTTASTVPSAPRESVQDVQAAWDIAVMQAREVKLTNEELSSLDGVAQGRGAARRALQAQKRKEALDKVNAEYQPRLDAAKAAQEAETAATVEQQLLREQQAELAAIQQRNRTESPPNAVARHPITAKLQSVWDEMNWYTNGDTNTVVNRLWSNPAFNNGNDVVSTQNVYHNNYRHKLIAFEDSMRDAVGVLVQGDWFARFNGNYSRARQAVDSDFQSAMQKLDRDVLTIERNTGKVPDNETIKNMIDAQGNHPMLSKAMKAYVDSDLAVTIYDDAIARGWAMREVTDVATGEVKLVNAFDEITRRPTYTPLKHSYDKMERTVLSGKASWDDIADFIGGQIVKMYPDLLKAKNAEGTFVLTERQVGQHFIQTQRTADRSLSDVVATGMNKEQLTDLLTKAGGLADKDARSIATKMFDEMHRKGTSTPKHLRRRIDWDWNKVLKASTGEEITMRDIVDDNLMGSLEDYSRGMAYRNGLADFGINSETELENLLLSYLPTLPKGADVQKVKKFMANTLDTMYGRAISDNPVPEGVRMAQAVADLFLLAGSGLYTMVDIANQAVKIGLIKSAKGVKQGLRVSFNNLSKLSHTEAKSLEDIISGRLLSGSKFKNFTARYADNFEVGSGLAEVAQYYGQTARFLNLSESLKRFQVGVLSSVYVDNLKRAMKGDAAELKFMREKLMIPEDTIVEIQAEYLKHGTKIDDWSNGVRVKYERAIFHDADNLAMNVHRGEVPAILEFSPVGRVIFPYLTYAFGMQNKVLKRTVNRDGYTGLAMLMAVQFPTAMLVAAANNVRKGDEYDKDLLQGALRVVTGLGSLNYFAELATSGIASQGVTALAPAARSYTFMDEALTGGTDGERNARTLLENSPLNAAIAAHIAISAIESD